MILSPPPRRILITRMKFIGDIVLTTPVIRSLRKAYPDAYIAYLGDAHAVRLLEGNPFLDEIFRFDFSRSTILEQPRVAWQLRRQEFDLVLDLFGNPRSALLTFMTGARVRVGLARKGRGRFYTVQIHDTGQPKTAVAFHGQFLTAVGVSAVADRPELFVTEAEREEASRMLGVSGPVVALHPGATWPAKRWLPDRFGSLAAVLRQKHGVDVVLTAGPRDADVMQEVRRHMGVETKVFASLPLRRLAALYSRCAAVVSNDAGPMHIAAAVGTPTIGLFGPGEEDVWFPYAQADGHRALRMDVPCHPCHLDVCNRTGDGFMACMKLLTVGHVADAVGEALTHRTV